MKRHCKTCNSALRQTLLEMKLKRTRYHQNLLFFQSEIEQLGVEIAKLTRKVKYCGKTV
jgi:hypothetical protein